MKILIVFARELEQQNAKNVVAPRILDCIGFGRLARRPTTPGVASKIGVEAMSTPLRIVARLLFATLTPPVRLKFGNPFA